MQNKIILILLIVMSFIVKGCNNQPKIVRNSNSTNIDKLEILNRDLEEKTWSQANNACLQLGNGWRLPTGNELEIVLKYKDLLGGFNSVTYWTSEEISPDFALSIEIDNIENRTHWYKRSAIGVRPVRILSSSSFLNEPKK